MKLSRSLSLMFALVLVPLAGTSSAAAAVTVGSTPASPADVGPCGGATLFVQDEDLAASSYAAPSGGVVTSWSMMGRTGSTAPVKLKVVREDSPDIYTIIGTTAEETITAGVLSTFPTRIEMRAGDRLALWFGSGVTGPCYSTAAAGNTMKYQPGSHPEPALGEAYPTLTPTTGAKLDVSVQLEPDADGDGFGDETQDGCPTIASVQQPCPVPETTITKAPRKLKVKPRKKKTATFEFSSAAGATFTCALDGAPALPCSSPFKAKVKKGPHTFEVVATSSVGIADPSPATATFKVKKKKPKR